MINRGLDADCRRLAGDLVSLAAQREPVPDRTAILDHLGRCAGCSRELQELTLTALALRRLGDGAEVGLETRASWRRLRARIERSRANAAALAWRWRTTLAGLAASSFVVAALVAPIALDIPLDAGAERVGLQAPELDQLNRQIEATYITASRTGVPQAVTEVTAISATVPRRYPDSLIVVVKEVDSRPIGRPPTVR